MKELLLTVKSKVGLHARPASMLVNLAMEFESEIKVQKGDKVANAKSIMGILSIAAQKGDKVLVTAEGSDEEAAIDALEDLFNNKFAAE